MSEISSGEVSGSEVSSTEVSGDSSTTQNGDVGAPEVSEAESASEVSESEVDEDFSAELDDSYSSYMEDGKIEDFEKSDTGDKIDEDSDDGSLDHELDSRYSDYLNGDHTKEEVHEEDIPQSPEQHETEIDDIDSELDKKYNEYIDEGNEKNESEIIRNELSEEDKAKLKEETGWSDEIVDSTKSLEEAEIYKKADLKEEEINGKKCLIRQDIDMEQKDEFGRTNKERMANGNPPLTEAGETVELHHIGQKQDSPLAELTTQEHRGKGNDTVLHDKQKESEIDRAEFAKERKHHWESRSENC